MSDGRNLACIVVENGSVSLYYQDKAEAEVFPLEDVGRLTISLRDPEGPCVWLETKPDPAPPGPPPEPTAAPAGEE